jgi:hypothetical protein
MLKNRLLFTLLIFLFALPSLAQESNWQLNETLLISDSSTQFTIAYPVDWYLSTEHGYAIISERQQSQTYTIAQPLPIDGIVVHFERIPPRKLREMGINPQADSLETVIEKLAEAEAYRGDRELSETTLLTWPALQLRTGDAMQNAMLTIVAFQGTDLIRLSLIAPSVLSVDLFLPTWEAMLESIEMQQGIVNLGDYGLNFECHGEGSPTVIVEAGWSNQGYEYMRPVIDGVSEFSHVCIVYRRNALGYGEIEALVSDLHEVLGLIGVAPPYVMAGHSYGGLTLRVFADNYPDEVMGMVFIDASHEEQAERFNETWSELYPDENTIHDPLWEEMAERLAQTGSLGDIPLIVLSAEAFGVPMMNSHREDQERYLHPIWNNELQVELAALSTQGRQIIVPDTNHITIVSHSATIEAIREVVELIREEMGQ